MSKRDWGAAPYARALDELRLTATCAGGRQAWLTRQEAVALLERLDTLTCDTCGERCAGEVVARFCEDCAVISEGSR